MRIREFRIDGFGHFAGKSFNSFDAPITVFYGPNEAGKSTLLAFVRTMLFGFPATHKARHYPALRGGTHGGRLLLDDERGTCYEIFRTEVGNQERLKIITSDGRQSSDDSFLAAPRGNASKKMFESVFAFSLAELQQFDTLSDGDVSAQIYSAGMGAANLPAALKKLEDSQAALFKPGGQNQKVALILKEMESVESGLREATAAAGRYTELVSRRDAIRDELGRIREQSAEWNRQREKLDQFLRAWEDGVSWDGLRRRLAGLPDFENFPADAIARLEKIEERLRKAAEERLRAERALAQAKAAVDSVSADLAVLESGEEIEHLRRGQQGFASSVADAPKREGELVADRAQFAKTLQELGPGWDVERLRAFDVSINIRAAVDSHARRLEEEESTLRNCAAEASRTAKEHNEAVETVAGAQAAFDALPVPVADAGELDRRRGQVRSCRSFLDAFLRARDHRDDLQAQAAAEQPVPAAAAAAAMPSWPLPAGLAAGGFLTIILGLLIGGDAALLGLGVGAALLAAGVGLLIVPRGVQAPPQPAFVTATRSRLESATQALQRTEADLLRAFAPFGDALPDAEALNRVEAKIDRAEALLRDWTAARDRLDQSRPAAARTEQKAADAAAAETEAQARLTAAQVEWHGWLAERQLPSSMAPGTVKDVFHRVEIARDRLKALDDLQHRLDAIRKDIREYADPAAALATRHGISVNAGDPVSVRQAVNELIRRFEAARKAQDDLAQAGRRLEEAAGELEERTQVAGKAEVDLQDLLKLGSASDAEAFRRNAQLHEERKTVAAELDSCERRLRAIAGAGDAFVSFLAELAKTDHATLSAEHHDLTVRIQELQDQREHLVEEQGGIMTEIARLTSEEETSALRASREVLKGRLEDAAREWAVATLARSLMDSARKEYERERQPGVIKHAGAFFNTITGGRYSNLMSPLDSHTLTVGDRDGSHKEPGQLSRGTQEQLYLALRFGLIRQFGEQACRLPVIVDEVLVNFDPERQRRAAEGFAELAHSNQVLVFTCHPAMVDLFTGACPDAQVIDLEAVAGGPLAANGASKLAPPLPLV